MLIQLILIIAIIILIIAIVKFKKRLFPALLICSLMLCGTAAWTMFFRGNGPNTEVIDKLEKFDWTDTERLSELG